MLNSFEILRVKTQTIEFMDSPYWIKEVVDDKFVMRYVNKSYERKYLHKYKKTAIDYIGKTDFEFWPKDIANDYHENDMKCYSEKSEIVFRENVYDGEKRVERIFFKKYICDPQSNKEYIVGFTIDSRL